MPEIFYYIAIALLLALSAFFSATEIAFASVSELRLKSRLQEENSLALRLANRIKNRYDDALSAILIGNTLVNIAASSIATVLVIGLLGEKRAWVATLVMTLLVLTFGEVLPKVLAKQFAEKYSVAVSVPVFGLTALLKPVSWLVLLFVNLVSKLWQHSVSDTQAVSEEDLENIIDIVEDEGVLDEEQCDLLQNALDFEDVCAYEIITPRVDLDGIDIHDPYEKNIQKILDCTYSRLPVYEDTPDHIIGILHLNQVFKELTETKSITIRDLLLPVTFVHKTMPLPDVLEKMKQNKTHMVVVLDEYGGTMGILTMEDVLEQLVGEIWDETDEIEREFVCVDETHYEAVGDMRLEDFFDEFDIDIEDDADFDDDNTTVGGWAVTCLEGDFHEGDTFTYENLLITVLEADERRVERIAVEILPLPEDEED